jgi:hypothetical protein
VIGVKFLIFGSDGKVDKVVDKLNDLMTEEGRQIGSDMLFLLHGESIRLQRVEEQIIQLTAVQTGKSA